MTAEEIPSPLTQILRECSFMGGVFALSYTEAVVMTYDHYKQQHGGIPQGGWLLAAAAAGGDKEPLTLDDEEVILLRVRDVTSLPNENDLRQYRADVVADGSVTRNRFTSVLDGTSQLAQETGALSTDVVGVFYTDDETGKVVFGAELDNVWSSARYQVFLPSARVLSWIGSYPPQEHSLPIGNVRFSATMRDAKRTNRDKAAVHVNVADFVSSKVAVLGLTRSGKSNTIKTLVTAVYQHAATEGKKIGQIIFDPQGEYSKVNVQDRTGLRLLGDAEQVRIYTANPKPGESKEVPLRLNFYDTSLFSVAWDMVAGAMEGAEANYVRTFRSADMERPGSNEHRAMTHWGRGHMAFYGLLYRAGYKGQFSNGASISFSMKDDAAVAFNSAHSDMPLSGGSGTYTVTSPEQASLVVDWINKMIAALEKAEKSAATAGEKSRDDAETDCARLENLVSKWRESDQFTAVADVFKYAKGRGLAGLRELREFHDPTGVGDINEMVWDDMVNGRLVIMDLSIGSSTVTKAMSERLIDALVTKASQRFRNGQRNIRFQVVVEEAHNLFERGRDAREDPWVRMSKEAAKYEIGLVYATQEVTSVDQRILSNTHNWIVANLNSDTEIRELAKYYNFADFGASIKRAEDRGYVRMKTMSSPYIVPTQIKKFDHAMVNGARVAAGLAAVPIPEVEEY